MPGAIGRPLALAVIAFSILGQPLARAAPKAGSADAPIVPKVVLQIGHTRSVEQAGWTRDGRLLSLGIDGRLLIWNPETGRILDRFTLGRASVASSNDRLEAILSIGGDYALAGVVTRGEDIQDGSLRILSLRDQQLLGELKGRPLGWTSPHEVLTSPSECQNWQRCRLTLVDLATGGRRPMDASFTGATRLSISPNGQLLAGYIPPPEDAAEKSAGPGLIRVWRIADLSLVRQVDAPGDLSPEYEQLGVFRELEFDADSSRVVARIDGQLTLVNVATGERAARDLHPPAGYDVYRVDFNADRAVLLDQSTTVQTGDSCRNRILLTTLAGDPTTPEPIPGTPEAYIDGRLVVARVPCGQGVVTKAMVDVRTGASTSLPATTDRIFAISPRGDQWAGTSQVDPSTGKVDPLDHLSTLVSQPLDKATGGRLLTGRLGVSPLEVEVSADGRRVASWLQACVETKADAKPDVGTAADGGAQACTHELSVFNIEDARFEQPFSLPIRPGNSDLQRPRLNWISGGLLAVELGLDVPTTLVDLEGRETRRLPIRSAQSLGAHLWIGAPPAGPDRGPVVYDEANGTTRSFEFFRDPQSMTTTALAEMSVSGDGKLLAATADSGDGVSGSTRLGVWDIASGKLIRQPSGEPHATPSFGVYDPGEPHFSFDSRTVYLRGPDETEMRVENRRHDPLFVWNTENGQRRASGMPANLNGWTPEPSPDDKILALSDGGPVIVLAEALGGRRVASLTATGATPLRFGFLKDGAAFWAAGDDGAVRMWSTRGWAELFTLYQLPNDQWMLVSPSGAYDTNLSADTKVLGWLMPDRPLQLLGPQTFMRDYFQPGLGARLMECNLAGTCDALLKPKRRLQDLNRTLPAVAIAGVRPAEGSAVWVDVDVQEGVDADAPNGKTRSGLHDLRLFRDGKLVAQFPTPAPAQPGVADVDLAQWATATALKAGRQGFKVQMPEGGDGKPVKFTAYAFNDDRVKGETAEFEAPPPKVDQPRPRRAYVIAVGVNAYTLPGKSLNFAVNDAGAVADALRAIPGYETVTVRLVADAAQNHAAKADLKAVLAKLAGQSSGDARLAAAGIDVSKLRAATPDDLVILSFSGHGYADDAGRFFLLPSDAAQTADERLDLTSLVSSAELTDWLRGVDAGEMAIVIDACHSGASVTAGGFKPGPMGDPGLGQLAFDKGIRILAATQADDVAMEDRSLQQGLLTYALVHDGLGVGGAAKAPQDDGRVRLDALLKYAVERMPGLAGETTAHRLAGRAVQPMLVPRTPPVRTATHVQQPALFDFTGQPSPVSLPVAGGAAPALAAGGL